MNGWTDSYKPRALCPVCGAWKEFDHVGLISTFMEGLRPGSPEYRAAADSRKEMRGFMLKHLGHCLAAGSSENPAGIVFLYHNDEGYQDLDPLKEEA